MQDIAVPLPDVRWIRLRHSHSYVSAGATFSLSPEADLGKKPEQDCPLHNEDPALSAPIKVLAPDQSGYMQITALPKRTTLVGFGLNYEAPQLLGELVEQLGTTPKVVNAQGAIRAAFSPSAARAEVPTATSVDLAVVPCLAPIVPSHEGEQVVRIDLKTYAVTRLTKFPGGFPLDRLRQAACRIDPDADNKSILAGRVSGK